MHYPFLVTDPRSGLQYRLTDTGLAELSLAPISAEWAPGRAIAEAPDPVWAESLANAPVETISAVTAALTADSELKPAGIPINYRPPIPISFRPGFRFEAGHLFGSPGSLLRFGSSFVSGQA